MRYVLVIETGPTELPGVTFAEVCDGVRDGEELYQCGQGDGDRKALASLLINLASVLTECSDKQAAMMLGHWRVEGEES